MSQKEKKKIGNLHQQEINEIQEDRKDLIQMYQAGFLDGCHKIRKSTTIKQFEEDKKNCIKAFEKRFINKLSAKLTGRGR